MSGKKIKYRLWYSVSVIINSGIEKSEQMFYYINRTLVLNKRKGHGIDEKEEVLICGGDTVCSGNIFLCEGNGDEPEQTGK